jgi:sarcosine oxidase delta subunit
MLKQLKKETAMYIEKTDLSTEISWLQQLQAKISRTVERTFQPNMSGSASVYTDLKMQRGLTNEEWEHLLGIAPLFVVEPVNVEYGFNFGIQLWHKANSIEDPISVFFISGKYLDLRFDAAWDTFSPLSHSDENRALLKLYGFEKPREKSHYAY